MTSKIGFYKNDIKESKHHFETNKKEIENHRSKLNVVGKKFNNTEEQIKDLKG